MPDTQHNSNPVPQIGLLGHNESLPCTARESSPVLMLGNACSRLGQAAAAAAAAEAGQINYPAGNLQRQNDRLPALLPHCCQGLGKARQACGGPSCSTSVSASTAAGHLFGPRFNPECMLQSPAPAPHHPSPAGVDACVSAAAATLAGRSSQTVNERGPCSCFATPSLLVLMLGASAHQCCCC
jgi:hypothetical protein